MSNYLKGECSECGGHIEFPAETAGTVADCPHCGKPTELLLAAPVKPPLIPAKTIVYTVVAIVILIGGLVGAMIALNRVKRLAQSKKSVPTETAAPANPVNPFVEVAFRASPVTLEKVTGSSRMYAVGSVYSLTNRQRFAVRVELDIFDANGQRINTDANRPSDYQAVIEPKAEWRFQAPVMDKRAVSAQLVSIKEQP